MQGKQAACLFSSGERENPFPGAKQAAVGQLGLWLRPCREHSGQSPRFCRSFSPEGQRCSPGIRQASPYNPGTTVQEQVSSGYIWEKLRKSPSNICRTVLSKFFSCRVDMISCSFLFSPNKGPARKFPCGIRIFYGKSLKNHPRDAQIGYTIIIRDCILELIINNPPLRLTKAGIDCKIVCCLAILFGRTASQRCFSHRCKR